MVIRDKVTALLDERSARRALPRPAECKRIREAAGLSRAALAGLIGVSRQALYQWETGACLPSASRAGDYLEVLSILQEEIVSPPPARRSSR